MINAQRCHWVLVHTGRNMSSGSSQTCMHQEGGVKESLPPPSHQALHVTCWGAQVRHQGASDILGITGLAGEPQAWHFVTVNLQGRRKGPICPAYDI